jgi:hypothetical protein
MQLRLGSHFAGAPHLTPFLREHWNSVGGPVAFRERLQLESLVLQRVAWKNCSSKLIFENGGRLDLGRGGRGGRVGFGGRRGAWATMPKIGAEGKPHDDLVGLSRWKVFSKVPLP